ncbi:MAG TPA: hypothetical protein VKZ18_02720 [Polyangia bacterium]|nr:hypothetical protein [Polyangia bacterium]
MNTVPDEIRVPGAAEGAEESPNVPVEFQPESGAIGPHEAAPEADDGTEPGDDL